MSKTDWQSKTAETFHNDVLVHLGVSYRSAVHDAIIARAWQVGKDAKSTAEWIASRTDPNLVAFNQHWVIYPVVGYRFD